jgi:prepilin-type N-terminal cleavage/methylation domain-containing protein
MREPRRRHTPSVLDSVKASRAGFGLSELLVVIAITGVLISVTVPMVLSYYHHAQNTTGALLTKLARSQLIRGLSSVFRRRRQPRCPSL